MELTAVGSIRLASDGTGGGSFMLYGVNGTRPQQSSSPTSREPCGRSGPPSQDPANSQPEPRRQTPAVCTQQ
jgi:hypothetical protein